MHPRSALASAAGVVLAATVVSVVAPSCAAVLDLDDYRDAIAAMCQCNEQLAFLGGRCEELLSGRLAGASESTRRKWLQRFADEECDVCKNVTECFYEPPTCGTAACERSEECCGFDDGTGYCLDGTCRRKERDCRPTGKSCQSVDQCCGSEVEGLAECGEVFGPEPACIQFCSSGSENCEYCGFVGYFDFMEMKQKVTAICFDGTELENPSFCDPDLGSEDCEAAGTTCQCDGAFKDACLFLCKP